MKFRLNRVEVLTEHLYKSHEAWGRRGMHIRYWWESQKERDHWEDQDIGGWTILKWMLER
jgi:hypothetical protein